MPREAKRLGAAEEVLPLASIADAVIHAVGARAMT
jgi:chemotaxis response regulator CheB